MNPLLAHKFRTPLLSPRYSVRSGIVFVLVSLSVIIVLASWGVYRDLAFDNHAKALSTLLGYETDEVFQHLEHDVIDVALTAQRNSAFRTAVNQKDLAVLVPLLQAQFRQYFVTAEIIRLKQSTVFDRTLIPLAQVTDSKDTSDQGTNFCPGLVEQAQLSAGADRLVIRSGLCMAGGSPYFGVLIPVGGFQPSGYLLTAVDPMRNLRSIENVLNVVMRMRDPNRRELYRSPSWVEFQEQHQALLISHTLRAPDGTVAAKLDALVDIREFRKELTETRNVVVLVAAAATFLVVLLALWILQRTTLQPLQRMTEQLSLQRRDRARLGQAITIDGGKEVLALASVFNDMNAELARLYQRYRQMAYTDPLTSLPNRAWFQRRLTATLMNASQTLDTQFAVLMLDLDGFKEVNDTLGHHVGDALLRQVSERLRALTGNHGNLQEHFVDIPSHLQPSGQNLTVARLGGDEFAFLLAPITSTSDIMTYANLIAAAFEARFDIESQPIAISGSLGAAVYPLHGSDGETLLRRADVALYAAKGARQSFALYESSLDEHSFMQLSLRSELSVAIKSGELVLYFQPKLDLQTGLVHGVEALVRWQHPQRGLLLPDQFIPLAEKHGLIKALTYWVLDEALQLQADWRKQGININTAINLSSHMLYDLTMPDALATRLQHFNVPATAIELEITENATMTDPARALEIMNRISGMGVHLAIDDFGTGYSSLAYLKRLPVDSIKIDKSFVTEMVVSESDTKIVQATIDLAHNLSLSVVAEGVEDDQVLRTLRIMNCDTAQGFGISPPLAVDDLMSWLQYGWMRYHEQFSSAQTTETLLASKL